VSRSIYPALSGAKAAWTQMEMISNNLANSTSDGFKQHRMAFTSKRVSPNVLGNSFVGVAEMVADMSDGSVESTGVDTHLALRGRGFFVVQTDDGQLLQRAGNFKMNHEGQLVNQRGQVVLTDSGPLEVPDRERIVVDRQGVVRTDTGGEIGKLRVVDAPNVTPVGHGQWRAEGDTIPVDGTVEVLQGSLEKSNVDPMRGMVELMEASRHFEAYQKAMQTSDELDGKANDIMRKSR
jgi:flagellar basal-body rod protein FlgF